MTVLADREVMELDAQKAARRAAAEAETHFQFDLDISGIDEAEAASASLPKPPDWYMDLEGACGYKKQSLEGLRQRILKLEEPNAGGPDARSRISDTPPGWIVDNDGWPDLLVTSYNMSLAETARNYLALPHNAGTMKVYKNLGNGAFRDATAPMGLDKSWMPMGANFGDIDNDGYPDIYLGMGDPSYASLAPHMLLRNQEGRRFVDVDASSGTGEIHKGHAAAFADIDNDGDEDILTVTGGAVPGDSHMFRLFENSGHNNEWVSLKLEGVKANRSALCARIQVTVNNQGRERAIYRTVSSGGSFGASPLEQHIGLGKSVRTVSLEIIWPGDPDHPQKFSGMAVNQPIAIKQGSSEYAKIERRAVHPGGIAK